MDKVLHALAAIAMIIVIAYAGSRLYPLLVELFNKAVAAQ